MGGATDASFRESPRVDSDTVPGLARIAAPNFALRDAYLTDMRLNQILRRLLQLPLFTSVAVLTLAIGIGANAAIFSVIEGVLLKPLPYPHPDELVILDHSAAGIGLKSAGAAPFLYFTYREDGRVFQDVAMWESDTESVTGLAEPEEVRSIVVTEGLLPMLG